MCIYCCWWLGVRTVDVSQLLNLKCQSKKLSPLRYETVTHKCCNLWEKQKWICSDLEPYGYLISHIILHYLLQIRRFYSALMEWKCYRILTLNTWHTNSLKVDLLFENLLFIYIAMSQPQVVFHKFVNN